MVLQFVQSRLSFAEAAVGIAGVLLLLIPVALTLLLFWKRNTWRPDLAGWRWRIWQGGLVLAALAAIVMPIFLLGIQFLSDKAKQGWFIDAGTKGMFGAFLIAPVAVILLGFGKGRQRWLGIVTGLISFAGLYISLLAISA